MTDPDFRIVGAIDGRAFVAMFSGLLDLYPDAIVTPIGAGIPGFGIVLGEMTENPPNPEEPADD